MRAKLMLAALLLFGLAACDDTTGPAPTPSGDPTHEGTFDPDASTFVIRELDVAPPGSPPILVDLIGTDLEVDPVQDLVSLRVALRNASLRELHPPAQVVLRDFRPSSVTVTNAIDPPEALPWIVPDRWIFDYSSLLGPGGVLGARGQSAWMTWIFHDPGLEAFRFVARASLESEPVTGVLAGFVFRDTDQDGIRQPGEPFWAPGEIRMTQPDGSERIASLGDSGFFRFRVEQPGLYHLRLEILLDCVFCFTTPNPVEVLLPPATDGAPESYWSVEFGIVCGACQD